MLPTKQRFRWPADARTLHTNTNKLPAFNMKISGNDSSIININGATIGIGIGGQSGSAPGIINGLRQSAHDIPLDASGVPASVPTSLTPAPASHHHQTHHQTQYHQTHQIHHKSQYLHPNLNPQPKSMPRRPRMASQHVIAVLDFLEQQEREVQSELARVAGEVRALRRVVRGVRRDYRKRKGPEHSGKEMGLGSGSDADTEEVSVSVVVVAAD